MYGNGDTDWDDARYVVGVIQARDGNAVSNFAGAEPSIRVLNLKDFIRTSGNAKRRVCSAHGDTTARVFFFSSTEEDLDCGTLGHLCHIDIQTDLPARLQFNIAVSQCVIIRGDLVAVLVKDAFNYDRISRDICIALSNSRRRTKRRRGVKHLDTRDSEASGNRDGHDTVEAERCIAGDTHI